MTSPVFQLFINVRMIFIHIFPGVNDDSIPELLQVTASIANCGVIANYVVIPIIYNVLFLQK